MPKKTNLTFAITATAALATLALALMLASCDYGKISGTSEELDNFLKTVRENGTTPPDTGTPPDTIRPKTQFQVSFYDREGRPEGSVMVDSGKCIKAEWFPYLGVEDKDSCEFKGWFDIKEDSELEYEYTTSTKIIKRVELYAVYWCEGDPVTYELKTDINLIEGGRVTREPIKPSYTYGDVVTVTAEPNYGHEFAGWTVGTDTLSTNLQLSVTIKGDTTITANFRPATHILTVIVNPPDGGEVSLKDLTSYHLHGTNVTIKATSNPEFRFTGWTGVPQEFEKDSIITITMDRNKTLTANFQPITFYTLNANAKPAEGGEVRLDPPGGSYNAGTLVRAIAVSKEGYKFSGWSGALSSTRDTVEITMNGGMTLTAVFVPLYTLTTVVNPDGGGTVSRNPDKKYYDGETVIVTATPTDEKYRFAGWSGASSSTRDTVEILMDSNKELTANFKPVYTLTIGVNSNGGGTVSRNPAKEYYDDGDTVIVTATPTEGRYTFAGWSGASTSTNAVDTIIMNSNKELTAKFDLIYYELTIELSNNNFGSVSCQPNCNQGTTRYTAGTRVTVTATPKETSDFVSGYWFNGWYDDKFMGSRISKKAIDTIAMDSNRTLYANFQTRRTTGVGGIGTTMRIGNRTWMAENLKQVTDSSSCYDKADTNCVTYGRLYTWNAAMNACPAGWHLPDTADWNDLIRTAGDNIDNINTAGRILKSDTYHWDIGNDRSRRGIDSLGFNALPGGEFTGKFEGIGDRGRWWSSTKQGILQEYYYLGMESGIYLTYPRATGPNRWYSVRCVRNED